jgi:uncharacterized protein (TIGR03083 family)
MGEVGDAYRGVRERITELVRDLDDGALATVVPACPEWSVKDVVAHVCGVVDDALAGRLDGVATDPWTAAQVEARRSAPISDVLAEWAEKAPAFEAILDDIGPPGRQAVFDCVTHEHDVRGALRAPGARDSDAVAVALSFLGPALESAGAPVRVRTADGKSFGPDDAPATLTAEAFEIIRAATGRRSVDQIRAMDWSGDVDAGLSAFTWGPFTPRGTPLSE